MIYNTLKENNKIKKKNLILAMIIAIMLPCIFVLSGCEHKHDLVKVDAVAPTCEVDGNSEYYTCSCGKYFKDTTANEEIESGSWVIDSIGHNYQQVNGTTQTTIMLKNKFVKMMQLIS